MDCIRPVSTLVFVMVEDARRWVAQLEAVRAGVGAEIEWSGRIWATELTDVPTPS